MIVYWDTADSLETYRVALGQDAHPVDGPGPVTRLLHDNTALRQVVIGPDVGLDQAAGLAEEVRLGRPEVGVILLRRRLDVTVLSQSLRSGVREVVAADDQGALVDAVRRSEDLTARLSGTTGGTQRESGKVITVFSAKGGVGKTTLSTNAGAYLAKSGTRTLLVDLDLAFGDVGISLHLTPLRTINDARVMGGHLDPQGLASLITTHRASGLDVLAAPHDPGDADRIPAGLVAEILRTARGVYDYILVDTPPSFTEHVLTTCDHSDLLILVATLDIPAVKNLRVAIDTLDTLGSARDNRVIVLNRADAKVGLTSDDVAEALGTGISGHFPGSLSVPAAVNKGVALTLEEPRHPVSVAITEFVDREIRLRFGQPVDASRRRRRTWFGSRP